MFLNDEIVSIISSEFSSKLVASYIFEPDVAQLTEEIMSTATKDFHYDMLEILLGNNNKYVGMNGFDIFMDLKTSFDTVWACI